MTVPTLDGEREIEVDARHPARARRGAARGRPAAARRRRRGNQRVILEVVVPTNLSEEQREIAERLDESLEDENLGPQHGEGLFGRVRRAFG